MKRKAIIISISGTKLSLKERNLIRKYKPWGIILFKRNLLKFNQIKKLTNDIRDSIKDKNYPILIDEEGGSVSRLSNILDNSQFSQKFFGKMLEKNPTIALKIFKVWKLLGSKPVIMDKDQHDKIFAITSHLPHLIAYNLILTATTFKTSNKNNILK